MESQSTVVCVRLRPASAKETGVRCINTDGDKTIHFQNPDKSLSAFGYDKVYGEGITQEEVFQDCKHIVSSVLNGYNGTILAYGQTGSGKTHTLIGNVSDKHSRGMVPRAVQALGEGIAADTSGAEYEVRLSVVETYCERIRDLLDPSRDNLLVKQDAGGAIFIEGALEAQVGSEDQLVQVMHGGLAARTVAATCMNEQSSRSHCIVTVTVEKTCPDGSVLVGKLKMVDLAGSERQDKTHAAGQTLVEGSQINKSLSALANVIYALTDAAGDSDAAAGSDQQAGSSKAAKHVPYRDSKLTRILQDSLGGTSRTMLIICCSPCLENGPETLSSLRFGSRARGIKNKIAVNIRLSPEVLQQQLAKANAQIKELQKQLADAQQHTAAAVPIAGSTAAPHTTRCTAEAAGQAGASSDGSSGGSTAAPDSLPNSSISSPGHEGEHVSLPGNDSGCAGAGAALQFGSNSSAGGSSTSAGSGTLSQLLLSKQVPWWQHVLITGMSVVGVMTYMSWESRWYVSVACAV